MKALLATFFLLVGSITMAQESRNLFFWEAGTSFDYTVIKNIGFNTSLTKRSGWNKVNDDLVVNISFFELSHFTTYKLGPSSKVSLGYNYRWREPFENDVSLYEHRLTQQFGITHNDKTAIRLASRFRTEQRFKTNEFEHRYRYRIGVDFPLSGRSLNIKEFYLAFTNETLLEVVASSSWENRLAGIIGYFFSKQLKLQASITYRLENIGPDTETVTFISTGAFFNLD